MPSGNPGSYKEAASFAAWAPQYFASLREDLQRDGIDPEGTPDERSVVQTTDPRWFLGCGALLLVVLGLVALLRLLGK